MFPTSLKDTKTQQKQTLQNISNETMQDRELISGKVFPEQSEDS